MGVQLKVLGLVAYKRGLGLGILEVFGLGGLRIIGFIGVQGLGVQVLRVWGLRV